MAWRKEPPAEPEEPRAKRASVEPGTPPLPPPPRPASPVTPQKELAARLVDALVQQCSGGARIGLEELERLAKEIRGL